MTEMHPIWLRFADPAVERAFWRRFAGSLRGYFRAGAVLLPALFAGFGAIDPIVAPTRYPWLWGIRFCVVVPALVGLGSLFFIERARAWVDDHVQELLLAIAAIALAGLLAVGGVELGDGRAEMLETGAMGGLLALTCLYGLGRLRVSYVVPLSLAATLVAEVMLLVHPARTTQLLAVAGFYGTGMNVMGAWISWSLERLLRRDFVRALALEQARARSDALLAQALPQAIAARLRESDDRPSLAERHEDVTVVLADLVGFTSLCDRVPLPEVAALLDRMFSRFDALGERHGVEKIKTLGDGWLACAGVPASRADHAEVAVDLALEMLAVVDELQGLADAPLGLRIGVCSGSVVAGVIGRTRFAYDLWGDAVTGASEMEHGGATGRVRTSWATAARLPARFGVERTGDSAWVTRK